MSTEKEILNDLQRIPGIGKSLAYDLYELGITSVEELKGKNPQHLYENHCLIRGTHIDRCVLYTFRCAVYFAETKYPDSEKLKWWMWSDKNLSISG